MYIILVYQSSFTVQYSVFFEQRSPTFFLAALPDGFEQRSPPFKTYPLSLPISPAGQRWTPAFFASLSEPSQKKLPASARFGRRVYMSASGQDFHGGTLEGNCRHRALLYQFFFPALQLRVGTCCRGGFRRALLPEEHGTVKYPHNIKNQKLIVQLFPPSSNSHKLNYSTLLCEFYLLDRLLERLLSCLVWLLLGGLCRRSFGTFSVLLF